MQIAGGLELGRINAKAIASEMSMRTSASMMGLRTSSEIARAGSPVQQRVRLLVDHLARELRELRPVFLGPLAE